MTGLRVILGAPAPPGWVDGGHPLAPRVSWEDGSVALLRVHTSVELWASMGGELSRYRRWLHPRGEVELRLHALTAAEPEVTAPRRSLVILADAVTPDAVTGSWDERVVVVGPRAAPPWRAWAAGHPDVRVVISEGPPAARLNLGLALTRGSQLVLAAGPVGPDPRREPVSVLRVTPVVTSLHRRALERIGGLHEGFATVRRAFDDFALRAHAGSLPIAITREAVAGRTEDDARFTARWGIDPSTAWPEVLRPAASALYIVALPDPATTHRGLPDGRTFVPAA